MSLDAHRDAPDPAAGNRRIALACLGSLLLHVSLLVSPGFRTGPPSGTAAPVLEVRIEPPVRSIVAADALPAAVTAEAVQLAASVAPDPVERHVSGDAPEVPIGVRIDDAGLPPPSLELPAPGVLPDPPRPEAATASGAEAPDSSAAPRSESPRDPVHATGELVTTNALVQEAVLARRLTREARQLLASNALQGQIAFRDDDRRFTAVLTRQPAADGLAVERLAVELTAEHAGQRLQTSLLMKRLAFSHFTQLVDRWDPRIQLHDDEVYGRFHSNSDILVTYDPKVAPRLIGQVTTANGIQFVDQRGWRSRREIFAGGLETRTPRIRLPDIALPVGRGQAVHRAEVHIVPRDALLVFHADGTYDCIELESGDAERRRLVPQRPTYIVGARDAELGVRGEVNGWVTVYSPERIVVQGSLTYAHGARTDDDAGAYLGLVSDGNVEVDRAEVTGPGDLEIHAAVYARRRFVVREVSARERATLIIHGSLTAGSLSETEPRFATRVHYDPRFERVRPPGFPETDRYEIERWDGRWRPAEASAGPS